MAANPGSISSQPAAAALTGAEVLPLDQAVGSPVAATALTIGTGYRIASLGNTNWAAAGAGATPAVGTVFTCTAIGAGTGTAQQIDTRRTTAQEIAARALQDPTAAPTFASLAVTGTATLSHIHGNIAGQVYEHVHNVSGVTLPALTPYRVTGSQGNTDRVTIVAARADDPALMPASGILAEALASNGDGHGVVGGVITGVNTEGLTSGAPLYVAPTGGTTATMPTTGLVQVVAIVGRVRANTGTVIVLPGSALPRAAYTGSYGDLSGRPGEISQAEAEAGTETAFRLWSAARWRQAVAAWWAASAFKAKLDGIASGATANSSDAALLARANHTGTQTASTITGLAAVAASGSYSDLSGRPTLGTAAAANTTDFDPAGTASSAITSHLAAADAHSQYTTQQEAAAAAPVQSVNGQTGIVTLGTGDVAESGANLYFTSSRAIGAVLAGFAAAAGTVAATDSILQAFQKIVGNIAERALSGLIGSSNLTMNPNRLAGRITTGVGAVEEVAPAGGMVLIGGSLVPGEIVKLIVSNIGETGITTGNFKNETRIDRPFTLLGLWWNCHPIAMGSASTSDARPYIRTGAGTTSAGTKTNILTTANNIASLAASVHTVDATSSINGGAISGSAGDWLGVDLMSVGTGSSGHFLTFILRYS